MPRVGTFRCLVSNTSGSFYALTKYEPLTSKLIVSGPGARGP